MAKLKEIVLVIDDPSEEETNKIHAYDNPFWGSIDINALLIETSFGRIRFDFKDNLIIVSKDFTFKGETGDLSEDDAVFVRENRNKVYSVKYIITDVIKTFASKQALVSSTVWYSSDGSYSARPYGVFVFDKEFYDITSSEIHGVDCCCLDGIYNFTDEQIKLYEFVGTIVSKYQVSNKTHNSESYEEHIKETIKGINPDMRNWDTENLALLKLST